MFEKIVANFRANYFGNAIVTCDNFTEWLFNKNYSLKAMLFVKLTKSLEKNF